MDILQFRYSLQKLNRTNANQILNELNNFSSSPHFQQAIKNLGFKPKDIQIKTVSDFSPNPINEQKELTQLRYEHYLKTLKTSLLSIIDEREAILKRESNEPSGYTSRFTTYSHSPQKSRAATPQKISRAKFNNSIDLSSAKKKIYSQKMKQQKKKVKDEAYRKLVEEQKRREKEKKLQNNLSETVYVSEKRKAEIIDKFKKKAQQDQEVRKKFQKIQEQKMKELVEENKRQQLTMSQSMSNFFINEEAKRQKIQQNQLNYKRKLEQIRKRKQQQEIQEDVKLDNLLMNIENKCQASHKRMKSYMDEKIYRNRQKGNLINERLKVYQQNMLQKSVESLERIIHKDNDITNRFEKNKNEYLRLIEEMNQKQAEKFKKQRERKQEKEKKDVERIQNVSVSIKQKESSTWSNLEILEKERKLKCEFKKLKDQEINENYARKSRIKKEQKNKWIQMQKERDEYLTSLKKFDEIKKQAARDFQFSSKKNKDHVLGQVDSINTNSVSELKKNKILKDLKVDLEKTNEIESKIIDS